MSMPGNVNKIDDDERIVEIEMERLRPFRSHPFKVKDDQEMKDLMRDLRKRFPDANERFLHALRQDHYDLWQK